MNTSSTVQATARLFCIILVLFLPLPLAAADAPSEVGGFRLGDDITEYPDIEYGDYLKQVIVNDQHGFRKGIISYGTCAYPGKIVKISMKYENPSKDYYELLLKTFKERFGTPNIWQGDAFGILYVWKWTFVDDHGRKVNLILQHNLHQHDENIGNSVKLSYPERMKEERLCFIEHCKLNKKNLDSKLKEQRQKPDWDYLIPR